MMLHRSRDEGGSWEEVKLLDAQNSAYSQLLSLKSRPGEIGNSHTSAPHRCRVELGSLAIRQRRRNHCSLIRMSLMT
jgi:hypothetical protein